MWWKIRRKRNRSGIRGTTLFNGSSGKKVSSNFQGMSGNSSGGYENKNLKNILYYLNINWIMLKTQKNKAIHMKK